MKKELQLPEFKDLNFDDFAGFAGGRDTVRALRKIFDDKIRQARVDLNGLWGNEIFINQYDEARNSIIRECYVELAEADFMTKSVAVDVGRLILSGVVLTKVLKKIERLKDFIANKRQGEEMESDWENWGIDDEE
ncbi:MAG: hypothetical protein J6K20_00155 [Thermoguttaceae bacterium]|nr:hypothetical protein [Thermoguttaceae bacterium]